VTPRHVRALRGAAAAWVATIVAATAHTLAGGGAPAPALVAAIGILVAPFAVALIGRTLAAWRVATVVVAAQGLFHVAFALTADADASPASVHSHHFLASHPHALAGAVAPDAPMLAGHLLAAAVTVLALFHGERMLRALGRGIRSMFSRLDLVAPRPPAPHRAPTPSDQARAVVRVVLSDLSRRGPPAFVAAL
jgi:hypothetical protein